MKERNIGINILKFFAAPLITNSHMGMLYGKYDILSTGGGAIGNVLFCFCSSFTLFLGRMRRFDNWYKRRIIEFIQQYLHRPFGGLLFNRHYSMDYTIIHGGEWFVTCIMIYYVILYFVQRFKLHHLKCVFGIAVLICIAWYCIMNRPANHNMYGATYFK